MNKKKMCIIFSLILLSFIYFQIGAHAPPEPKWNNENDFANNLGSVQAQASKFNEFAVKKYGLGSIDTKECTNCNFNAAGVISIGSVSLNLNDATLKGAVIKATNDGFEIKKEGSVNIGDKKFTLDKGESFKINKDGTFTLSQGSEMTYSGKKIFAESPITVKSIDNKKIEIAGKATVINEYGTKATAKDATFYFYVPHVNSVQSTQGNAIYLDQDKFIIKGIGEVSVPIKNPKSTKVLYNTYTSYNEATTIWTEKNNQVSIRNPKNFAEATTIATSKHDVLIRKDDKDVVITMPFKYTSKDGIISSKAGANDIGKLGDVSKPDVQLLSNPSINIDFGKGSIDLQKNDFILDKIFLANQEDAPTVDISIEKPKMKNTLLDLKVKQFGAEAEIILNLPNMEQVKKEYASLSGPKENKVELIVDKYIKNNDDVQIEMSPKYKGLGHVAGLFSSVGLDFGDKLLRSQLIEIETNQIGLNPNDKTNYRAIVNQMAVGDKIQFSQGIITLERGNKIIDTKPVSKEGIDLVRQYNVNTKINDIIADKKLKAEFVDAINNALK